METIRMLVVDDEEGIRNSLRLFFQKRGHDVDAAAGGAEAIAQLKRGDYDLVLTDVKMPGVDGLDVIRYIANNGIDTRMLMMTGYSDVETAVEAMRLGALDYVSKPFDMSELEARIRDALGRGDELNRTEDPGREVPRINARNLGEGTPIIGSHATMQALMATIERYAPNDATVLIHGESGTGKELVARELHRRSGRADAPLIPVNCAAIPENLLESELFGHVKGAFTGAMRARQGLFALADGGTVFLDEIGEMPLSLQVKLLRVLQEGTFLPVGGTTEQHSNFRVIAATNKELHKEVEAGRFREDLYYRLGVLPITTPPLRERRDDIPELVRYFVGVYNERKRCRVQGFSPEALEALRRFDWPGNVRQLQNIVQRMVILKGDGLIYPDELPPALRGIAPVAAPAVDLDFPDEGIPFNDVVSDFEDRLIISALRKTKGNKKRAAEILHLKRTTLVEKMKKKGLNERFEQEMAREKGLPAPPKKPAPTPSKKPAASAPTLPFRDLPAVRAH